MNSRSLTVLFSLLVPAALLGTLALKQHYDIYDHSFNCGEVISIPHRGFFDPFAKDERITTELTAEEKELCLHPYGPDFPAEPIVGGIYIVPTPWYFFVFDVLVVLTLGLGIGLFIPLFSGGRGLASTAARHGLGVRILGLTLLLLSALYIVLTIYKPLIFIDQNHWI